MGEASGAFLVRKGHYELHYYVGFEPALFDLDADPEETSNLASDPAHSDALADLDRELHIRDLEAVDQLAKADERALVERFGGPEQAAFVDTAAEPPAPRLPD